ncbi:vacuolar-sorting protein SNF8 [Coccinella septempunctata]|uniref:vacuolar-sorting protein SNF8 n=1 Tax=Coccinella septempunctata TaxID=41139 RepID=UPI001D084B95|nr:vacuolar-sorting protein SNF8 [Coccinella septempunctata]
MRRGVGLGAIQKHKIEQAKYTNIGNEIQENQIEQMTKQLEVFRVHLEDFATKHKNEIKKNGEFRRQFQEMCATIGVDPLSSGKGFWSVLGIGDFYYELAVQIVEVCLATNAITGGLIGLDELRTKLIKARGQSKQHQEISKDDLLRAAQKLKIFGSGFSVVPVGNGKYMVHSVPGELNMDHGAILQLLSTKNWCSISINTVCSELKWKEDRAKQALEQMLEQGLSWIDTQDESGPTYYFPSLFNVNI